MKLADMQNNKLMDIFGDLCYEIAELCEDKEIEKMLSNVYKREDFEKGTISAMMVNVKTFGNYTKILGYIMKEKRNCLFTILALVNQEDLEVVKTWNPVVTMQKTKELFGDKDFLALLPSQLQTKIEAFQNMQTKSE